MISLKRQLLVSFALQGVGSAAVLLATLLLGARLGPEVQGTFSRSKSEVEFVAAFAMFGLPQALFFHVKSGGMPVRAARRWTIACTLVSLPLAMLYGIWRHAHEGGSGLGLLSVAVAAAVAYGLLRALLLVCHDTSWFNVATAMPQVQVLIGVGAVIVAGAPTVTIWFALFGLAYATAAAMAWVRLRGEPDAPAREGQRADWKALGSYGAAAWLTAALTTAAMLAAQYWVERGAGRVALGQFTMAMTLVQVPLTPITYAAPLLFRRWMERPGARAARRGASAVFALLLLAAALASAASAWWPNLGLGTAYAGATQALAVLLVGAAAEAASRVLTVQASATGLPWLAVRAEAMRWIVLVTGWWIWPAPDVLTACVVWAAGAWAATGAMAWHARRDLGEAGS